MVYSQVPDHPSSPDNGIPSGGHQPAKYFAIALAVGIAVFLVGGIILHVSRRNAGQDILSDDENSTYVQETDVRPPQDLPDSKIEKPVPPRSAPITVPRDYVSIPPVPAIYDAAGILDAGKGTIQAQIRFIPGHPRGDHAIVHTDDSRIVLYIDTLYSPGLQRNMLTVAARAVGNTTAPDGETSYPTYPEARIFIDNDGELRRANYSQTLSWVGLAPFPEGEWHTVTTTWQGSPEGITRIYLDGRLASVHRFSSENDDGSPLFNKFSVGYRAYDWTGQTARRPEQDYDDYRTALPMSIADGGIEVRDIRIFLRALTPPEVESSAKLD